MFTLYLVNCVYGSYVVFSYGDKLVNPLIISNFPAGSVFGNLIKILYCLTLIVTIPLTLSPAHLTIEDYLFGKVRLSA